MKKFKKFSSFLSVCLSLSVVLGNFSLPTVFAYEKGGVNFGQVGSETMLDNGGATFNKINSSFNEIKGFSSDLSISEKEKTGLEKSQQIEGKKKDYVGGEILVKYKNNEINLQTALGRTAALNFINSKSLEEKEDLMKDNISILRIKDSKTVEEKIDELKNDPNIEYIQPNFQYYPADINTDDTYKGLLWGLDNTGQTINGSYGNIAGTNNSDIDAPEAWAITINEGTRSSIVVAVIDSGVAYNHPDLAANMWDGASCKDENGNALGGCNHGYDYENNDKTPLPTSDFHGTHIAGTIAAAINNGKGIIGVAPNAKIMAVKTDLTTSQIIAGINFAKNNNAKIINASWLAYSSFSSLYDVALYNAIKDFNGLFVVAAGNSNYNQSDGIDAHKSYPGGFEITTPVGPGLGNIVTVAATDQNDALATFSNYGATSVDVGAPGTNIYSTVPLITDSSPLSESFSSVANFSIPSGWTQNGFWGVWNTGVPGWNQVLYSDVSPAPYHNNADTIITVPTTNLGGATAGYVDFWAVCDTEYITSGWADYMQLEYSADGVNFSVPPDPLYGVLGDGFRWDEPTLDVFSGENPLNNSGSSMFHYNNIPIPSQYLTSNFKLRFRWVTNASDNNYNGCFVDDVRIIKRVVSDGSDEQYDYSDGTSMAAPHVAGLAALLLGYKPELSYTEVKNIILNTGDYLTSLSGKTVTGKRINAYNALSGSVGQQGSLEIAAASETPGKSIAVMGTNDNEISKFRITSTNEAFYIEKFSVVLDDGQGIDPTNRDNFSAVKVKYQTEAQKGTSNWTISTGKTFGSTASLGFSFSGSDRIYVPKDDNTYVTVLASIATYNGGDGAKSKVPFKFYPITGSTDSFSAYGAQMGNRLIDVTEPVSTGFNLHFVARSKPVFAKEAWSGGELELARFSITAVGYDVIFAGNDDLPSTDVGSAALQFDIIASPIHNATGTLTLYDWNENIVASKTAITWGSGSGTNVTFGFEARNTTVPQDTTKTFHVDLAGADLADFQYTTNYIYLQLKNDDGGNLATGSTGAGQRNIVYNDGSNEEGISGQGDPEARFGMPALIKNIGPLPINFRTLRGTASGEPPDTTPPILSEVTPVLTPTNDNTPNYTFNSNEAGTISYAVGCPGDTNFAVAGNNTVTFNVLADGIHSGCTIVVTDSAGNSSLPLNVSTFVINTTLPVITYLRYWPDSPIVGQLVSIGALASDDYLLANTNLYLDDVNVKTCDFSGRGFASADCSFSTTTLKVGLHTYYAVTTDSAGNTARGPLEGTNSFTVVNVPDTTPPTFSRIEHSPALPIVGQLVLIHALASDDYLLANTNLYLDDVNVKTCDYTGRGFASADCPFETTTLSVGIHTYYAVTTDSVGNSTRGPLEGTYSLTVVNIPDITPPVITLLGDNPVNLYVGETYTDVGATALDNLDGDITANIITVNSVNTSAVNTFTVTYNVSDAAGNLAIEATRTVNVLAAPDTTAPVITLLGDNPVTIEVETTYNDAGATAVDDINGDITEDIITVNSVNSNIAGVYTVTYNVTDSSGNAAIEVTRIVNVLDTTGPVVTAPADQTFEATGVETTPTLVAATATDNVDPSPVITYAPHVFPVGITIVTWTATDASGNSSTTTSNVTIQDTTPPAIASHEDVTVEADSSTGAVVNYDLPTATDLVDGLVTVVCTPLPGTTLLLGDTLINCTSIDTHSNLATSNFTVHVVDTTAPIITVPADINQEANGILSTVDLGTATAIDTTDPNPVIINDAPATFSLGTTIVTWTATDFSGNHASATQNVVIVDTILPVVNVNTPASPTKNPSITFTATDKTLITTECKVNDGEFASCVSPFEPTLDSGIYTVTVRAIDAAGNIGSDVTDSFIVDINSPTINITGPVAISQNTDPLFTFDSPDGGANFECKLDSSEFTSCTSPVLYEGVSEGSHEFVVRATDEAGNIGMRSYNFTIDLTPPAITIHDDILSVAATDSSGAVVTYIVPDATDTVDGTFSATCSSASGSTFALGTTLVTCNASDVAGNAAIPTIFNVTVEDKTPPVITLIGNAIINLAIGQIYTELGATAIDNVDGDVTSHIVITGSVDTATAGTYYIDYNVSDAAGNNAEQKTRTVIVSALEIASEQKADVSTNSVTIQWTTSHLATSRVLYDTVSHPDPITGTAPNYGYANSTTEDTAIVTNHSVIMNGLSAGTTYYMRPVSHGSPEILGDEIAITTNTQPSSGGGGGGGGGYTYSSVKAITAFGFTNPAVTGVINESTHSIVLTVLFGTNITNLVPTIVVSSRARISPNSGIAQNFTNSIIYTVTAENNSTQTYTVSVVVLGPGEVKGAATTRGANPEDYGLKEGNLIRAEGDFDIFIINQYGYKRLFLNPAIFNMYGHLGSWKDVITVTPAVRDAFITSTHYRYVNEDKVYHLEVTGEDTGKLHWINMTADSFLAQGGVANAIFIINKSELDWYPKGAEKTSL